MPPPRRTVSPVQLPRAQALVPAILVQRRNRFLADARLPSDFGDWPAGSVITAHCPNTGAMEGLTRPGTPILLDHCPSPNRKLAFTWELARIGQRWIGTNTSTPNRLISTLLQQKKLALVPTPTRWVAERGIGHGRRVDFVLETGKGANRVWTFLEVKNCHLAYPDGWAYFPDCVSERAAHHLNSLERLLREPRETLAMLDPFKEGDKVAPPKKIRSVVLFVVQIPEVIGIRPSEAHDPEFAEAARRGAGQGVEFFALTVSQDAEQINVGPPVSVDLDPYALEPIRTWMSEARNRKNTPICEDP
jgi:sugar fermentation stimulation protein A